MNLGPNIGNGVPIPWNFTSSTTLLFFDFDIVDLRTTYIHCFIKLQSLFSNFNMPSSSFYLSVLSALSSTAFATQYTLKDSYAGSTFLDGFTFFSDADPTNGFVKYVYR
jgi:hypothetical protein